jgi:thioredoxin reductase
MRAVYAAAVKRVIVIGAGPMGLEAALLAAARGFDVTVLEAGEVGAAVRRWGATRAYSPLSMNLSARARALVGDGAPPPEALLTGPELAERVLVPLARSAPLAGRVRTGHRVVSVGRARMRRDELAGHPLRGERAFRLLVETPEGERIFEAEALLDASGVYGQPLPLGAGGVLAPGERALGDRVVRQLGVLQARVEAWGKRRVLLVGHGHSAAHAVALLAGRAAALTWAVRAANARPVADVAVDPLPERAAVVARANAIATAPPAGVTVERRAHVEAIATAGDELVVTLSGQRRVVVDEIVALTGYRPDLAIVSELAVELAPSSEGAGRLRRAIADITDCLSVPVVSARDLESGEPGFALVGHKSYGRSRAFLLQTGLAQLETIVAAL